MSWKGVKKQSIKAEIEAWCEEMEIENYTINSKGEIDVDGGVYLIHNNFYTLNFICHIDEKFYWLYFYRELFR